MEEKIQAILAEEGFVEKLMDCEEPEQVQALFAEKGVELGLDDVMGISKGLKAALDDSDELDEDSLDSVAGGSVTVAVIGAVVTGVSLVVRHWRSIKNFFRRW